MAKVSEVLDERRRQSSSPVGKTVWASSSSGQRSTMPTKRNILIVEDDEDTRELYACCLSLEGFAVQSASDGVEGMARLRAERPNLLVLDFALPRLSGAGVLRQLRMDSELELTPVILVSAQIQEFLAAVDGLPFDAALEKPCELADLVRVVHAAMPADPATPRTIY
jgi:two-component system response regulator